MTNLGILGNTCVLGASVEKTGPGPGAGGGGQQVTGRWRWGSVSHGLEAPACRILGSRVHVLCFGMPATCLAPSLCQPVPALTFA